MDPRLLPIFHAIDRDDPQALDQALGKFPEGLGANVPRGEPPLLWAAMLGRWACVDALIVRGAEVNVVGSGGFTPWLLCARGGHLAGLRAMADKASHRRRVNVGGLDACMLAAQMGALDCLTFLLDLDPMMIQQRDRDGRGALAFAIEAGSTECARLLLDRGGASFGRLWSPRLRGFHRVLALPSGS